MYLLLHLLLGGKAPRAAFLLLLFICFLIKLLLFLLRRLALLQNTLWGRTTTTQSTRHGVRVMLQNSPGLAKLPCSVSFLSLSVLLRSFVCS